jgi:hypothetical protein
MVTVREMVLNDLSYVNYLCMINHTKLRITMLAAAKKPRAMAAGPLSVALQRAFNFARDGSGDTVPTIHALIVICACWVRG